MTPTIHAWRHAARRMEPDSPAPLRPFGLGSDHDGGRAQADADEEQGGVGCGGDGESGKLP